MVKTNHNYSQQEAEVILPWSDCKVVFEFDGDVDDIWDSFYAGAHNLPNGWSLNATNGAGARSMVIFRVEGDLLRKDGDAVAETLRSMEQTSKV